jgi:SAM-dependent methyltransferase
MLLAVAYWASRCLHVVAELGVADKLGDEPQTAESLARAIGAQPQALHRVLRSLANHGIFVHDGERFAHNAESRTLRSDARGSMRSLARMMGMKVHWDAYRELDAAVRTGQASIEKVTASGLFSYLREHPEEGRIFDEAMEGKSSMAIATVPQAYDFSAYKTIGDIGGGLGHLLYAVLEKAPHATGVLFELPDVAARARARNVPRVSYVGGDFFKDPIPACDLYMMMTVLHDWSDAQSEAILRNLRAGAPPKAKLLLIEGIVDPNARDDIVLDVDIEMLVMTTGRERTRVEWESVLARGGFRLTRIVPVGPSGLIEAEAV